MKTALTARQAATLIRFSGYLALAASLSTSHAATTNDPLNPLPSAADEVLYYYDYADDGISEFLITDRSSRGNSAAFGSFLYDPGAGLGFLLPGARAFDVAASGSGAVTETLDVLTHQDISSFGGYTFETYLKRTAPPAGVVQHIWNPEGMHSIEILATGRLQLAIRGLNAYSVPIDPILPLDEWHHVMAVMTVTQPLPAGGDPAVDPLLVKYELFIDGVSLNAGTTGAPNFFPLNPLPPGGSADLNNPAVTTATPPLTLELSANHRHGIGWNEFGGAGGQFLGQMAMTRLTLGALTPQQSLFDFPPQDADFDNDGDVDGADFLRWQRNVGLTAGVTPDAGDANADGKVDAADLAVWKSKFGLPVSLASQSSVPEPGSLALCMFGALAAGAALSATNRSQRRG